MDAERMELYRKIKPLVTWDVRTKGEEAMTITDEMLKHYKALQRVFKKAIRPIRDGDMIYCPDAHHLYFEGTYHPCPLSVACSENEIECKDRLLHIPLPIDPVNPERGLEGMICGSVIMYRSYGIRGWRVNVTTEDECKDFVGHTPTLALLKALAHQWGVEVK